MGKLVDALIKPFAIVKWSGKEVSRELSGYVGSLTFTDVLDSEKVGTDTVSLSLNNDDGRFYDAWFPEQGDSLECGIGWYDDNGSKQQWIWGTFTIDSITFIVGQNKVNIGANAKPPERGDIDNEQSSEVHEQTSFVTLAEDVAKKVGVQTFLAPELSDVTYPRVQQRDESQLAMLGRLANENSIPVAFKSNKLVIGEINQSTLTLDIKSRDHLQSATFPISDRAKYDGVIIDYFDPLANEGGQYVLGNTGDGAKVRRLYEDSVTSMDEAAAFANNFMTKGGSKQTVKGRITVVNATVTTADIIKLTNAGQLPSTWKPTSVSTSLTSTGWQSSITVTRQL